MKFVNKYMKWVSTAFILSGIVLTSINFYPLNIFVHGAGSLGWTLVGYVNKDRALMVKFWNTNSNLCVRLCKSIFLMIKKDFI
jgi:hypothetical protein